MTPKGCVILVVGDETVSADLKELLENYGYERVAFNNPEKALEFFAWNADRIDLIISDVVMPGLDGFEVAKQASTLKPDIAVILLNASGKTLPGAARVTNVRAVLEKPSLKTDLLQIVEGVLTACTGEP